MVDTITIDPATGDIDAETARLLLAEVRLARHRMLVGGQPQRVRFGEREVQYFQSLGDIDNYIAWLLEIINPSKFARRPISLTF